MGRYISNINSYSYQDNELLLLKQGFAKNHKEFLSTGTTTWTIDRDVIARVRVWGGGGGGAIIDRAGIIGTTSIAGGGGGGGAGGAAEAILRLNAGTYNITVGIGGPADGPGGSSSFHTYITCSGGGAGGIGSRYQGGLGGSGSFDLGGFGGFLYIDSRFGGAGGSFITEYCNGLEQSVISVYQISRGSEGGEGESGGRASYAESESGGTRYFGGGGGGGYNPPFIYGPGRGVGTGGDGGRKDLDATSGQPGAVVIEWN